MSIENLATHPAKHVTPEEFAEYLHVSRKNVYYWVNKGSLVAIKCGRRLLITIDEARRFGTVPARIFTDGPPSLHP